MADMPPTGHSVQLPWILERVEMPYGREEIERLRRAVYSIGRVPESGFQGGVLSPRIASVVLDYAILTESLLESRRDLQEHRPVLEDCRDQLKVQASRCTDGQPELLEPAVRTGVGAVLRHLQSRRSRSPATNGFRHPR